MWERRERSRVSTKVTQASLINSKENKKKYPAMTGFTFVLFMLCAFVFSLFLFFFARVRWKEIPFGISCKKKYLFCFYFCLKHSDCHWTHTLKTICGIRKFEGHSLLFGSARFSIKRGNESCVYHSVGTSRAKHFILNISSQPSFTRHKKKQPAKNEYPLWYIKMYLSHLLKQL